MAVQASSASAAYQHEKLKISMTTSTNLPAELIDIIAHQPTTGTLDKKGLSACSLTCHYWAKVCRPLIFWKVVLRSREDVEALNRLFESPRTELPKLIQYFVIEEDSSAKIPWVHLVSIMVSRLPLSRAVWLNLSERERVNSKTSRPPRSAYAFLPKTLPGVFAKFTNFELSHYTFRSFIDLMRLIASMPMLKNLICSSVKWVESPASRPQTVRPVEQLESIRCSGVQHKEQLLWLLSSAKGSLAARIAKGSPALSQDEDQLVREVLKCLFPNSEANSGKMWNLSLDCHLSGYRGDMRAFYDDYAGLGLTLALHSDRRALHGSAGNLTSPKHYVSVASVEIDIRLGERRCMTTEDMRAYSWETLDALLVKFPRLARLRVSVDGSRRVSQKVFSDLAHDIEQKMTGLLLAEKVEISGVYLLIENDR